MLLKVHSPSSGSPNILSIPTAPNTLNDLKTSNAPNTSNTSNDPKSYSNSKSRQSLFLILLMIPIVTMLLKSNKVSYF